MKTINKDILIFKTEDAARRKFNTSTSVQLLYSEQYKTYYLDFSKTAMKEWPNLYKLIAEK